jgi:chemotaxis regulatin CheY-phosphate phosphatase CheZ
MKQDSIRSLASLGFTWSSDDESPAVTNHASRHRRTLSRRDSLLDELGESLKKMPLDRVAEEAKSQVPDAIFKVSLER